MAFQDEYDFDGRLLRGVRSIFIQGGEISSMSWDIGIGIGLGALTIFTMVLGGHLTSTKTRHKWAFYVSGILMLALITKQTVRTALAQRELDQKLQAIAQNTEAKASVTFSKMAPYAPSLPFKVGRSARFNMFFVNQGNEAAADLAVFSIIYLAAPGNEVQEKQLDAEFEQSCKRMSPQMEDPRQEAGTETFFSINAPELKSNDLDQLKARSLTLYFLTRAVYNDHRGHHVTDSCFWMQNPIHDLTVARVCKIHVHSGD
jgi:hypothetical protein